MANRTGNQAASDANSRSIASWKYAVITANTTTAVAGLCVLHGFNLITPGTNWTLFAFDNATTLGTAVYMVSSATPGFIAAGDVICNNGLTIISTQGTAGVIGVLYL